MNSSLKKICSKCREEKSLDEFYFRNDINNYRAECKICRLKHDNFYYLNNREQKCKEAKIYRDSHKEQILQNKKFYYINNKEQIIKTHIIYEKQRRQIDKGFQILTSLRTRLGQILKNNKKSKRTLELLGCTTEFLKKHLESQFKEGMTWDNYGRGWNGKGMKEWHIVHIKPCALFDLSKPEEQRKCFHYTNLQPLWAEDNLKKSKKYAF